MFYAHMILEMNACWAVFDQHGFELGIWGSQQILLNHLATQPHVKKTLKNTYEFSATRFTVG